MLPERLKSLRKEANLTQKEVAEKLGFDQKSYSFWENGKRNPKNIQQIADFFNVSTDYLLGNTDNKKALSFDDLKEAIINSKTFNHRPLTDAERNEIIKMIEDKLK